MTKFFSALVLMLCALVAGCGGGGGPAGECMFQPACTQGSTAGGSGGGGASTPVAFNRAGSGPDSFTLPSNITTVHIQAQTASNSANFIVYEGTELKVNVVVGAGQTPPKHDGTYAVKPGATINITSANGVDWVVSSTSADAPPPLSRFNKVGTGDTVFTLPAREARYRIRGSFSGNTSNFIVRVGGELRVNALVGSAYSPSSFDGTFTLPAAAQVEISSSSGVEWSFTEVL